MSALITKLRRRVLAIPQRETTFARRGFTATLPGVQQRMEGIGTTFAWGYHAALEHGESVGGHLDAMAVERQGWAYEGAAMALALLDCLSPLKRDRVEVFLAGPADAHAYLVHIGVGWALARLRKRGDRYVQRFNPLLRPLVCDGYGFHEGYFHWPRTVARQQRPRRLTGYALRGFDQGLGRSLWFSKGADVRRILDAICDFDADRRGDLWSGVGLACAYAGGVDTAAVGTLRAASKQYAAQVAQGAAFAAEARRRAGNPADHTDNACRILCGVAAEQAAAIAVDALEQMGSGDPGVSPAYEQWRQRVQSRFTTNGGRER